VKCDNRKSQRCISEQQSVAEDRKTMLGICIEYSWHLKLHIWSAYGFTILGDVSACSILDITLDQGCVNKKKNGYSENVIQPIENKGHSFHKDNLNMRLFTIQRSYLYIPTYSRRITRKSKTEQSETKRLEQFNILTDGSFLQITLKHMHSSKHWGTRQRL
jgi:hypothetical protein